MVGNDSTKTGKLSFAKISPRIFDKNQNGPNGILRGPGETY